MSFSIYQSYFLAFLWVPAIIGYGGLLLETLSVKMENNLYRFVFLSGLAGLGVISGLTTIANFFLPISMAISFLILAVGYVAFFKYARAHLHIQYTGNCIVMATVFIICFGLSQIGCPLHGGDTMGYHIQCVKWIQESTVPVGIVHFVERLASNNSLFMISAVVELGIFTNYSIFITNGFFVFFISIGIVGVVMQTLQKISNLELSSTFLILSLFTVFVGAYKFLGNLYIELSTGVLTVALVYLLIELYECSSKQHLVSKRQDIIKLTIFFAAFGITLKLSMLVISFFVFISALLLSGNFIHEAKNSSKTILVVFALLVAPWILRSVFMSGTILYPVASTRIGFLEWTASIEHCNNIATMITDWAKGNGRTPDIPFQGFEWVENWIRNHFFRQLDTNRTLAVIVVSLMAMVVLKVKKHDLQVRAKIAFVFFPIIMGLIYWFLTAPDVRFGFALWYSLAFLLLSIVLISVQVDNVKRYRVGFISVLFVVVAIATFNDAQKKIREIPDGLTYPGLPVAKYESKLDDGGVKYFELIDGNCGNTPLPCGKPPQIFIKHNPEFFKQHK